MSERIIVGVCTYNRGAAIIRTLGAIAAMRGWAGRLAGLVVVDNRSTDGTGRIAREFLARARRELLAGRVLHEPGAGKTAAIRRLFAQTDEPLVAIIDDDCLPDEGWAEAMLSLVDEHARAGAVGGPVTNLWERGPTRLARIYHRSLGDQLLGEKRLRLDNPRSFLMGASMVYRRRAVEESGWLESSILECRRGEKMECGEDAELCLRIRAAGWEVWYEPRAEMRHQIPARRQTAAYLAQLRGSICRSEPWLDWMAAGSARTPRTLRWAREREAKARRLWLKSVLLDMRPRRRRIRIAERAGRLAGWRRLIEHLELEERSARG